MYIREGNMGSRKERWGKRRESFFPLTLSLSFDSSVRRESVTRNFSHFLCLVSSVSGTLWLPVSLHLSFFPSSKFNSIKFSTHFPIIKLQQLSYILLVSLITLWCLADKVSSFDWDKKVLIPLLLHKPCTSTFRHTFQWVVLGTEK